MEVKVSMKPKAHSVFMENWKLSKHPYARTSSITQFLEEPVGWNSEGEIVGEEWCKNDVVSRASWGMEIEH